MKLSLRWILDYLLTMAHSLAKKNERNASSSIIDLDPTRRFRNRNASLFNPAADPCR